MLGLAWKHEALHLALRIVGIEDDQLVAFGVAGEVTESGAGVQVVLLAPHPLEAVGEALLFTVPLDQFAPCLTLDAAAAPVKLEEDVAVEVGVDVVEIDGDLAHS